MLILPRVLRLDFLESSAMAEAFVGSLKPEDIISNIELLTGQVFNPATDLLILDEIGECPLTFHEFLLASNEATLVKAYENRTNIAAAHNKLFDKLTDYYFTGGMPEAVRTWFDMAATSIVERSAVVSKIHQDLVQGYQRDFGKYAGKADSTLIESVFRNIPAQLSLVLDDSVKRFKFKGVAERKSRYSDFDSAIAWLEKCRLVLKNYPIEGMPRSPLAAYQKENYFKWFLFDIGLLNNMLGISYKEIKRQGFEYKGYLAENFVQQELAALGLDPTHSWQDARAEIEFIVSDNEGNIIPIEVKSGKRTRAKSLQSYIIKCKPLKTIKLTATQGSSAMEQQHIVLPLYYSGHLNQHVNHPL